MSITHSLYPASSRGLADHGWLKAAHTFSFASYHDPKRMHFGVLRVINDDQIAPGMGFGTHPHDNMEIITIVLEGALAHKDSMGNTSVILPGEVQVMSAGTGVTHSEFNASDTNWTKLFQIWVLPNQKNVDPRYGQKKFDFTSKNQWVTIVESMDIAKDGLGIYQDVRFSIATISKGYELVYSKMSDATKVFAMVISGSVEVDGHLLQDRDGIGISDVTNMKFTGVSEGVRVLVMDVAKN
jgi:redox-sensitive bicupin YhaK (pirin superfamily)